MAKNKQLVKFGEADTLKDIGETDLVYIAKKLLDNTVQATNALNIKKITEDNLPNMRLVVSLLNATKGMVQTKMQYFRMMGITDKIKAVKAISKSVQEK